MSVRVRRAVLLAACAVLLSGCRIDVGADVAVDRTGGGEVAVSVRIDGATLRWLDEVGVDPALDVALGLGAETAWRSERVVDADGGLVLTYRQKFVDGAQATALLRELSEDVAPEDPALLIDVVVATSSSGAVRIDGTGALSPPETLGVRLGGEPAGPSGAELAALVERSVRAQLVVRVPGRIVEHDADAVDGATLRWALPVGEPRPVTLVSDAPALWRRVPVWVGGVVGLLAVGATAGLRRTRRGDDVEGDGAHGGAADGAGVSPAG